MSISVKKQPPKVDNYFHVLHNPKYGMTNSFKVHKSVPYIVVSILLVSFVVICVVSTYCYQLSQSVADLEAVNSANRNLKSEVEALTLKIKSIQLTMNQMETLSSKIKKASTRLDDRTQAKNEANSTPSTPSNSKQSSGSVNETKEFKQPAFDAGDTLGFGPLTKEDFELSQQLTGVKKDNLQLKTLFEEVDNSEADSSKKLVHFKQLMLELRKYNLKLQTIPDIAPARGRLSSTYGWRISPFSGKDRMHLGLDIAAPMGSPIYATADGTVVRTAVTEDYGRMLEVQHNSKLLTRYGHTSMLYVKEGQKVKKGQIIAAVGSTGWSTGPHVHYEIEVAGKRVNPETYIVLW